MDFKERVVVGYQYKSSPLGAASGSVIDDVVDGHPDEESRDEEEEEQEREVVPVPVPRDHGDLLLLLGRVCLDELGGVVHGNYFNSCI